MLFIFLVIRNKFLNEAKIENHDSRTKKVFLIYSHASVKDSEHEIIIQNFLQKEAKISHFDFNFCLLHQFWSSNIHQSNNLESQSNMPFHMPKIWNYNELCHFGTNGTTLEAKITVKRNRYTSSVLWYSRLFYSTTSCTVGWDVLADCGTGCGAMDFFLFL